MERNRKFALATAVLSALIALGVAEGLARVFYRSGEPGRPAVRANSAPAAAGYATSGEAYDEPGVRYGHYGLWVDIEWHSYLSYAPEASSGGLGYRTNDRRFRYETDLAPGTGADELRIFITGGSTAWGAGVRQEKTYARVLEERLQATRPDTQVRAVITAVSGYASTQERIRVANDILDLEPDYVVMFTGWNDAYFGYKGVDLLREQDWLGYRAKLDPDTAAATVLPDVKAFPFRLAYVLARMRYLREHGSRAESAHDAEPRALTQDQVLATFLHNVHQICDMRRRFDFQLVVALQPTLYATAKPLSERERVWAGWAAKTNRLDFSKYNRAMFARYRAALPEDARANDYVFVDLDRAIAHDTRTLFVDDAHFGDRGHKLLGTYLADALETHLRTPRDTGIPSERG